MFDWKEVLASRVRSTAWVRSPGPLGGLCCNQLDVRFHAHGLHCEFPHSHLLRDSLHVGTFLWVSWMSLSISDKIHTNFIWLISERLDSLIQNNGKILSDFRFLPTTSHDSRLALNECFGIPTRDCFFIVWLLNVMGSECSMASRNHCTGKGGPET